MGSVQTSAQLFAVAPPGLELIVEAELRALPLCVCVRGGVNFVGHPYRPIGCDAESFFNVSVDSSALLSPNSRPASVRLIGTLLVA